MGKQQACRACGAPVIWAQSVNGRSVMLDKQRDLSGSSRHAVRRDTDLSLHVRVLAIGEQPKPGVEHLHQPHYATCPERRQGPGDG
jgi:hypothetical protein